MPQKKHSPHNTIHRLGLRAATVVAITLATLGGAQAAPAAPDSIKAFKLCTGADNNSHVLEGTIDHSTPNDVTAIHFKQTPAHSSYGWHNDPEP
jgi:hypothetical protein